jgi:hypothetical protein
MLLDKLADGVLQVETPIGPRYIRPSFLQRASLLWTFRIFDSLPQAVLSGREQRMVDRLCSEHRFVPAVGASGVEVPVIGIIEKRLPPVSEQAPPRKPMASQTSLAKESREAASA